LGSKFQPDWIDVDKGVWAVPKFMMDNYSPGLVRMIYGCMRPRPEERSGVEELQRLLREGVDALPEEMREFVESARQGIVAISGSTQFALEYSRDGYRIGMAMNQGEDGRGRGDNDGRRAKSA
jgi:hypothetical protein